MRILNMTVQMGDKYEGGEWEGNMFQLMLGDTVLCEGPAGYGDDLDDAEQWAAEKLKELFNKGDI